MTFSANTKCQTRNDSRNAEARNGGQDGRLQVLGQERPKEAGVKAADVRGELGKSCSSVGNDIEPRTRDGSMWSGLVTQ